VAGVLEEYKK